MAFERRGHANLHTFMDALEAADDVWQVALEMDAEGQKIRDDDHALCALGYDRFERTGEIRTALVEEGSLHQVERSLGPDATGNLPHRIVGGFDTRSMSEDHDGSDRHGYDCSIADA